jgi:hypothetical protein
MPQEGFEPTIPVFERAKTVHDLDTMGINQNTGLLKLFNEIIYFYSVNHMKP